MLIATAMAGGLWCPSAGAGDKLGFATNISNSRRLNMHIISSLAVLFSGEQRVSQVHDFKIKFILVMENALLC